MKRKLRSFVVTGFLLAWGHLSWSASTSTWTGTQDDNFNNAANWNGDVPAAYDTAAFSSGTPSLITISTDTSVNKIFFGSGAPSYTLTVATGTLTVSGYQSAGIQNNSGVTQNIQIGEAGRFSFNVNNLVSSVTVNNNGGGFFYGNSGNITVNNNHVGSGFYFVTGSAQSSKFSNNVQSDYIRFDFFADAGQAEIANEVGAVYFDDNSSASNSTITNTGDGSFVVFENTATAGKATIINDNGQNFIEFAMATTAGNSSIKNYGTASVIFGNDADAGTAQIENYGGTISFDQGARAASAAISISSGTLQFNDHSSAGAASITLAATGGAEFHGSSIAGLASINNNGASVNFSDISTAYSSDIVNSSNGSVNFSTASSAGNATITNNMGSANFFNVANAGNSHITNLNSSSIIQFNDASNAGNSTLTNNSGGLIQFNNLSGGGNAAIVNNGGTFSINNVIGSGFTVGSIASNGTFDLGSHGLNTGGDGTSTNVSGTIGGNGASIVKVGTGTLTLSGSNTYTGGTTVSGGTLGINNDNNLGVSGGVTLSNGGTLQTNAGITSLRGITLTSGGGAVNTNGFDSSWLGNINGSGALVKSGAGTLTISGSNSYSGGTTITGGMLKAGSTTALPNNGAVNLANSNGTGFDLNGFDQTIGSLSGGGNLGGDVSLSSGAILTTGMDNRSSTYGGSIDGTGSLVKVGTGTLTLSGADIYTGSTTVMSGGLDLTGSLRGAAMVLPTASFSNAGAMGGLVNQGIVTPGVNGIGTLTVSTYSGPGTLAIVFNGAAHNALNVTGAATLMGGRLAITGDNFATGQYNVLTAGSITGTFASVSAPLPSAFLTLSTVYTPTDLQVNIHSLKFSDLATTGNQQGVSAALDAAKPNAAGDLATAIQAIYALPTAAQARAAYNRITGDSLGSFQNSGLRSAEVFTNQMNDRSGPMEFARTSQLIPVQIVYAGDLIGNALGLNVSEKPTAPERTPTTNYGLWSRGLGFFDKSDANASVGSPSSQATTGGFQAGYDFVVAQDVLFGLSGGYANTSVTVDDRSSSGNSTSIQSGVYGSYTPGLWFLNGSMAYTTSSNNMTRDIQFTGVNETATANFQSRTYTTFAEGGYHYQPREKLSLEPSVSLKESYLRQEGFTESGAPGLDLTVEDQTTESLVSAIGGRITRQFGTTVHPFTVGVRAAWQHEWLDTDNSLTAQFAGSPGSTFNVQATPRSRNAAAVGLDGRMKLTENLQAFADYSAMIGSGQDTQGLFGGLSVKW